MLVGCTGKQHNKGFVSEELQLPWHAAPLVQKVAGCPAAGRILPGLQALAQALRRRCRAAASLLARTCHPHDDGVLLVQLTLDACATASLIQPYSSGVSHPVFEL
jgi:hypothetical protein